MAVTSERRLNLDEPRWDQSTYLGRAKHFFTTTNPMNLLRSSADLERAREIVTKYRKGEGMQGLTEDEVWSAKHLYDSAFHPDTGEKMLVFGRMSAQVPMNMLITGAMMTWYQTTGAVVFWQWFNQSFNAAVNYTNRSGGSPITVPQLASSYAMATSSALATALGLNSLTKRMPPLIGRWVPFAAVAAANCVNIPLMRRHELTSGIPILDAQNNQVGTSTEAAKAGITSVVISRVCMTAPSMVTVPLYMNYLEKRGVLRRMPWISLPLQVALCGVILTFATPLCCALFPQKASIEVSKLEPAAQEAIKKLPNPPTVVYYNKGL